MKRLLCLIGFHKWDTSNMPRPQFKGIRSEGVMLVFQKCVRCHKISFFLLRQNIISDKEGYEFYP